MKVRAHAHKLPVNQCQVLTSCAPCRVVVGGMRPELFADYRVTLPLSRLCSLSQQASVLSTTRDAKARLYSHEWAITLLESRAKQEFRGICKVLRLQN